MCVEKKKPCIAPMCVSHPNENCSKLVSGLIKRCAMLKVHVLIIGNTESTFTGSYCILNNGIVITSCIIELQRVNCFKHFQEEVDSL